MQKLFRLIFAALVPLVLVGCSSNIYGPERKLGRGINNLFEFPRGGELRRSMEQTAMFSGPDVGYAAGFIHGFNRSVARTLAGAYEIATFPIPNGPGDDYSPVYGPENPVYPANYKPGVAADVIFSPDSYLGFGGGDVAPFIPGSRFRVFDNF